jgi:putative transposase
MEMAMVLAGDLAEVMPVRQACDSLGIPRSAWYRAQTGKPTRLSETLEKKAKLRPTPPNALTPEEKDHLRQVLNNPPLADLAVPQAHTRLLDDGIYLASVSTMYRVLGEHDEVHDRRHQLTHPQPAAPVLCVRAPNALWSWDITQLPCWAKGIGLYLYVVLDVFSRFVVGWLIAERQSADLAVTLISQAMRQHGLTQSDDDADVAQTHHLTLLNDRGGPMTAKSFTTFLEDMQVRHVLARPRTSNDNAFSEAQFKTLKYRPSFPNAFGGVLDARGWAETFFDWYNHVHYHSGIAMLTPATVYFGRTEQVLAERRQTLARAFDAHPERFRYRMPMPDSPPTEVWINRPTNYPSLVQPAELTKLGRLFVSNA